MGGGGGGSGGGGGGRGGGGGGSGGGGGGRGGGGGGRGGRGAQSIALRSDRERGPAAARWTRAAHAAPGAPAHLTAPQWHWPECVTVAVSMAMRMVWSAGLA